MKYSIEQSEITERTEQINNKRSGDFQMFVVNEPMMVEGAQKRPLTIDAQTMIINKYGKEVEKKRIKGEEYDD